ncbi:MAG TPA: glycosyltransferase [Candidatus Limnocylindrales bacterium]
MPRREALRLLLRSARGLVTGAPVRPPGPRKARPDPAPGAIARADPKLPAKGSLLADAYAGLAVAAPDAGTPFVLGYYPTVTNNPFQSLLYDQALDLGIVPVGLRAEMQLDELELLQAGATQTLLHLHWLHPVLRAATSASLAASERGRFVRRLDRYLASGGRLAWTIHNVLPHEARFRDEEARLCAAIAERAAAIHVLTERTSELVRPYFELPPERVFHVSHPSYAGAYPDTVSRREARQRLRLGRDELVVVALGAIRPYKGLDRLLAAWAAIGAEGRRLVIAGPATDEPGVAALLERARQTPGVIVDPRKVPGIDVQVFLRSADVAVFPYLEGLNSGALALAQTFGLPAIVPTGTGLADALGPGAGRTYDPKTPDGLADALRDARAMATPEARAAASATLEGRDPASVSRAFATELRSRLG